MSNRNSGRLRNCYLRQEVAYRVARLIAEEGITNFAMAKQKAARQMGITDTDALPNNAEIDAALRTYQSIFQGNIQPLECRFLRQVAINVMHWLDRFSPWLVGAVLSGTANRFSEIELEIIEGDAKGLEVFFLNERMLFETRVKRGVRAESGNKSNDIVIYEISFDDTPIVIALYPDHSKRLAHHPRNSLTHARAQLAAVELLLAP